VALQLKGASNRNASCCNLAATYISQVHANRPSTNGLGVNMLNPLVNLAGHSPHDPVAVDALLHNLGLTSCVPRDHYGATAKSDLSVRDAQLAGKAGRALIKRPASDGFFEDDPTRTFAQMVARNRGQEQLCQAQVDYAHAAGPEMLREFAASMAHEVNQPLAAMRTNGETALRLLGQREPNLDKLRDLIQRMINDSKRASGILERIRTMAMGETPQRHALELNELVSESMFFLGQDLQSKGISSSLDLAPELPQVIGDQTQIQQVLVNIVVNAAQAMEASGAACRKISIQTTLSPSEGVRCVVEDSGPGVDPMHLPHLFGKSFTTKADGMGLGLTISRAIIESHGGTMRADNKSTLGGARFSFALPLKGAALSAVGI
jgi:C4-dicarboxylate-specific signal transduction histidine kinase